MESPNWQEIQFHEIYDYVCKGYFNVAGWINPKGSTESEHVAFFVPVVPEYSTNWGTNVLWTMDTGHNRRESKQKLSQSFSSKKKDSVYYFIYKK